jgi:DNA-directed RNA polymerase specialized sigma24 family protein
MNIQRKSDFPAPDNELQVKEIYARISKLDENQRLPFELFNLGYKYHEIADNLNISIGTVKSRIFLSRQKLMRSLNDFKS